ncbi:glycosyl transferase family protein [Mycobacteroides abscessus subsp. abscessus]|nr:glycosyl transferase family protein [Mycobacteroides abscessus subsp. abscessus]
MLAKVSVVVPIYKVEKFIHRCINSIIQQTYKELEIILVNDGSPDNCGKIINEYQSNDKRIIAIHKQNGGLSDARNVGMDKVSGEYVIFVDSDDWLEKDFIEMLIYASKSENADIVQSGFYYAYDDYLLYDERFFITESEFITLNNRELMTELVKNERVKNFAWGKLYKTELVKDFQFKKGVLFEDVFWAHNVMQRVEKYVISNKPKYYYYQRSDSIVTTYTVRNLDILEGLKERHEFIRKYYKDLIRESNKEILKACLIHYKLLFINKDIDKSEEYRNSIKKYINKNYLELKNAVSNDKYLRNELVLFKLQPFLYLYILFIRKIFRKLKFIPTENTLVRINISK